MREMSLADICPVPEYRLCAVQDCYEAILKRPRWLCDRHEATPWRAYVVTFEPQPFLAMLHDGTMKVIE